MQQEMNLPLPVLPELFICKYPQEHSIKRKRLNGEIYDEIVKQSCPVVYNALHDIWVCKRCGEELVCA